MKLHPPKERLALWEPVGCLNGPDNGQMVAQGWEDISAEEVPEEVLR